jgi:DNA-binding CsgD family transcriptional regulator
MSFPRDDGGRNLTALVSPVQGRRRDDGSGRAAGEAAAMLLLSDSDGPTDIPAAWVMHAFGLTLAEARVALCMATGASVPDTARRLRIARSTVRTHLREVFAKTGTRRQSALARLIASVAFLRGDMCGAAP